MRRGRSIVARGVLKHLPCTSKTDRFSFDNNQFSIDFTSWTPKKSAKMFPSQPVYNLSAPIRSWHGDHTTTTSKNNNNTQPEDIELAPTGATPKTPKRPRKSWPFRARPRASILLIGALILVVYIGGCATTRIRAYGWRAHERLFRAQCEGAGGRIIVHRGSITGWGVNYIDCKLERAGEKTDSAEEVRTSTRRLDMQKGEVAEWDEDWYGILSATASLWGLNSMGIIRRRVFLSSLLLAMAGFLEKFESRLEVVSPCFSPCYRNGI
jgi:hypothetical protein